MLCIFNPDPENPDDPENPVDFEDPDDLEDLADLSGDLERTHPENSQNP